MKSIKRHKHERLTKDEKELAWYYLMKLDDNTDKDIATKMNKPVEQIRAYLNQESKRVMERINKGVNERYRQRKKDELERTKNSKRIQNHDRI